MGQDQLPKKTMRWIPREHRNKGRSKKTWIEGTIRSVRDRGLNEKTATTDTNGGQRRRTF